MKIIEIPGLNKSQGLNFFNELNNAKGFENPEIFVWHDISAPNITFEDNLKLSIELLAKIINQNKSTLLLAKSFGSFLAIEALLKCKHNIAVNNHRLVIFGLPYRLGYPPDIKLLETKKVEFDDVLLSLKSIEKLSSSQIKVQILQGENDDLGPVSMLKNSAKTQDRVQVIALPNQSHNLSIESVLPYI